jgi:short-subunit dehydrogenase
MSTTQRYALITGATSGIGYELAKLFAGAQYNLVIVARNAEALERVASEFRSEFNVEVILIEKDLFKREGPFEVFEEIKRRSIQINVLVNDAGQGQYGEFSETDINREIDIIQLNIISYVVLTKLCLQEMLAQGEGKILNVSSIGAEMPGPLQSVYHATKAFVTSFTEAIRSENKDKNITITALEPGITDTDFFHKAKMEDAKMVKEGSPADPAKVAKDGFEALMSGDDKIVSGLKNKAMVGSSNVLPDSTLADMMHKGMEPSEKKDE